MSSGAADFVDLTFAGFAHLADEPGRSKYERIGFPDHYRAGYEDAIFADIRRKLPRLDGAPAAVLDIGPGCSDLPRLLIELAAARGHRLSLVDSAPMLAHLPDRPFIRKVPGFYPDCTAELDGADFEVILCYSVVQYIAAESDLARFIDASLGLLAPQGRMLIGDIPNDSKRARFLDSAAGLAYHRRHFGEAPLPPPRHRLDDTAVLGLLARVRAAGADAYVLPQANDLPMANRREDVLIVKP